MTSCACAACQRCCETVPGWYTPAGVRRLFQAYGAAARQLIAYDCIEGVTIVAPPNARAAAGGWYPHRSAELPPRMGRCALLTPAGRCSIHATKPRECREAFGCRPAAARQLRRRILRAWARPAARAFVARLLETAASQAA